MNNKLILKRSISHLSHMLNSLSGGSVLKKGFRVLNYHSITDELVRDDHSQMTTPKILFERQMEYLRDSGYAVLDCREAVQMLVEKRPIPGRVVCITFDDGFKDNLTNAFGAMKRFGFKATIFLTTDFIGKNDGYLNWDDISVLLRTGLFFFGAHSTSHRKLCGMDSENLFKELAESKSTIEARIKVPIELFAYPFGSFGSFDKNVKDAVRKIGYKAAFTTIGGHNSPDADLFELRRTRISWCDDEKEFEKQLLGSYDWYRLWQRMTKTP